MTHLPECPVINGAVCPHDPRCNCQCMCKMLRACEQRVRGRTITDVIGLLEQSTITAAALGEQGWQRLQNDLIEYRKVGFSD